MKRRAASMICSATRAVARAVAGSPDPAPGPTAGLPACETSGRVKWHGQETVPQRAGAALEGSAP